MSQELESHLLQALGQLESAKEKIKETSVRAQDDMQVIELIKAMLGDYVKNENTYCSPEQSL